MLNNPSSFYGTHCVASYFDATVGECSEPLFVNNFTV